MPEKPALAPILGGLARGYRACRGSARDVGIGECRVAVRNIKDETTCSNQPGEPMREL
jgi:hypothetical protein